MGSTTQLRRALRESFFPLALTQGFTIDRRLQPQSTLFRRRRDDRVQMFAVQWDKYGRPRFALHFGTCPATGLEVGDTIHPADEVLPSWCPDAGTLRSPRGGSWFRQDASFLERFVGRPAVRDATGVIDDLLEAFPDLDRYWGGSVRGPHLRFWRKTSP